MLLFIANTLLLISSIQTSDLCYFFYYESYWGYLITFFSLIASSCAVHNPKRWQKIAVRASEMAMAFNLVITPVFWYWEKPIFEGLAWSGWDLYLRTIYAAHHTLPIISSVTDLVLTKQYFLKKDWTLIFGACLFYIFANALGTYNTGQPIYPGIDWTDKESCLELFVF